MNQTQGIYKGIHSDQLSITNPMWEVNTAKMQASINNGAGAVNARLCKEARAAKAPGGQAINFNWDNTNHPKKLGWVSANGTMLVLDKDFNQSVDNGTELLSNPLVADAAKGLRSLAVQDEWVGKYSQICSDISPYDADILVKKPENWKIEDGAGQTSEKLRACQRTGRRDKQGLQGKNANVSVIWS